MQIRQKKEGRILRIAPRATIRHNVCTMISHPVQTGGTLSAGLFLYLIDAVFVCEERSTLGFRANECVKTMRVLAAAFC